MKEERVRLGNREFRIRSYDRGGLVIDSWMRKLAYYVADDYCNPPGFSWAVIIFQPLDAIKSVRWAPRELWPTPLEEELEFLSYIAAAIVKCGKTLMVDYFMSEEEAKRAWLRLKEKAQEAYEG